MNINIPSTVTVLVLVGLVLAVGCGDEHPEEVVGSWHSRRELGDYGLALDSLTLDAVGGGRTRTLLYSFEERALFRVDTLKRIDKGGALTWRVVRNDDGRHLCIAEPDGSKNSCAPLRVTPETEIAWGEYRFRKIGQR